MSTLKKFKLPQTFTYIASPNYEGDYPGGEHSYSDFNYKYDFWSEPSINQGHTGTCVYHSHIGGASKLLNNCLTGFSIANTIAYIPAWTQHHSSSWFSNQLKDKKVLVPAQKTGHPPLINEYDYAKLESISGTVLQGNAKQVFENNAISLANCLNIDYEEYSYSGQRIISVIKKIIDQGGVAMVSIDYPTPSTDEELYNNCFGNLWFKHKPKTSNYWFCNNNYKNKLGDWFKSPSSDGWHSVIFFGYAEKSEEEGVFAIKNSWGSENGENGNYYMSYNFLRILEETKGDISVTSMYTQTSILPENTRADNDFIQFINPTGKCITVESNRSNYIWWYNFGNKNPVPTGTGLWATNSEFGIPNTSATYTIKEYANQYQNISGNNYINKSVITVEIKDNNFLKISGDLTHLKIFANKMK